MKAAKVMHKMKTLLFLFTFSALSAFAQVTDVKEQIVDPKSLTFKPVDGHPEHCHAFLNGKFVCDTWTGCHPFATTLMAHAEGPNAKIKVKTQIETVRNGAQVKKCWFDVVETQISESQIKSTDSPQKGKARAEKKAHARLH